MHRHSQFIAHFLHFFSQPTCFRLSPALLFSFPSVLSSFGPPTPFSFLFIYCSDSNRHSEGQTPRMDVSTQAHNVRQQQQQLSDLRKSSPTAVRNALDSKPSLIQQSSQQRISPRGKSDQPIHGVQPPSGVPRKQSRDRPFLQSQQHHLPDSSLHPSRPTHSSDHNRNRNRSPSRLSGQDERRSRFDLRQGNREQIRRASNEERRQDTLPRGRRGVGDNSQADPEIVRPVPPIKGVPVSPVRSLEDVSFTSSQSTQNQDVSVRESRHGLSHRPSDRSRSGGRSDSHSPEKNHSRNCSPSSSSRTSSEFSSGSDERVKRRRSRSPSYDPGMRTPAFMCLGESTYIYI